MSTHQKVPGGFSDKSLGSLLGSCVHLASHSLTEIQDEPHNNNDDNIDNFYYAD